jgi:formate hydrogenlyase subunit 3/multisubunit Na+/H+ antiporter MnhD subunit
VLGVIVAVRGASGAAQIKTLLVYSSVLGLSWIIARADFYLRGLFLFRYSLSFLVIALREAGEFRARVPGVARSTLSDFSVWCLFVALLSIAGIPPFLGFFVKLCLLGEALRWAGVIITLGLLFGSA